jgi:hypothetical protein
LRDRRPRTWSKYPGSKRNSSTVPWCSVVLDAPRGDELRHLVAIGLLPTADVEHTAPHAGHLLAEPALLVLKGRLVVHHEGARAAPGVGAAITGGVGSHAAHRVLKVVEGGALHAVEVELTQLVLDPADLLVREVRRGGSEEGSMAVIRDEHQTP